MIENFPGNSRKAIPEGNEDVRKIDDQTVEEKKIEPLENLGKVVRRKKPLGRRLKETFFAGSEGVLGSLFKEVLIPALQDLATDIVKQGIERAVYGEVRSSSSSRSSRSGNGVRTHISYDRPGSYRSTSATSSMVSRPRREAVRPSSFDDGEILLESKFQADRLMEKLFSVLERYQAVTVSDLNDIIGETSAYTDHKWGWTDLRGYDIRRIREGYLLTLPEPEDLS